MPAFGFYMGGAAVAYAGRLGALIAWDPLDRGPAAVDGIDLTSIGLYGYLGTLPAPVAAVKLKSRSPVAIPDGCPALLDGGSDKGYSVKFGVRYLGTSVGRFAEVWLEVWDVAANMRVYGIAEPDKGVKVELAEGSFGAGLGEFSFFDRPEYQNWEDPLDGEFALLNAESPGSELWTSLMSPDQAIEWGPTL